MAHNVQAGLSDKRNLGPPTKALMPFDLSAIDLANVDELDADSLKAAIRAVKRLPLEATSGSHSSHSNTSPGTPSWSSHNSCYEPEEGDPPRRLIG